MEKRLCDASLKGDVEALEALMREDELILARVSISCCFNQTPLHLASMFGHFEFAKSLLSYMPDFASRLDSQGRSPLHLASANGHVNIAKLLLEQDPNMCRIRDEVGRTPLHLSIMNGQSDSVTELIKFNSDINFHDEDEKLLHLCVLYNRLDVLLLIESIDKGLLRIKDNNGNTILHSAAAFKRMEIIKYLVSRSEVDVNEVNRNGLTGLDIIEQIPDEDVKSIEIKELLIKAGANGGKKESKNKVVKMWNKVKKFSIFEAKEEVKDKSLLIAATVISAIAYQAAISPPGGVASMGDALGINSSPPDVIGSRYDAVAISPSRGASTQFVYSDYNLEPGTSILAYFNEETDKLFWISNTISFMASLSVIFLFVSGASLKRTFFIWFLRAAMWVTISAMVFAYVCAASAITPTSQYGTYIAIAVGLYVWIGLIVTSILVVVFRFLRCILRWTVKTIKQERAKRKKKTTTEKNPSHREKAQHTNIV